jgi:hypothetical protein
MKTEKKIVLENNIVSQVREIDAIAATWLLMIIIFVCAYVGYKITDVFSYAKML